MTIANIDLNKSRFVVNKAFRTCHTDEGEQESANRREDRRRSRIVDGATAAVLVIDKRLVVRSKHRGRVFTSTEHAHRNNSDLICLAVDSISRVIRA